jgi:hypothetical protein
VSGGEQERARAIQIACVKRRGREERKKERERKIEGKGENKIREGKKIKKA